MPNEDLVQLYRHAPTSRRGSAIGPGPTTPGALGPLLALSSVLHNIPKGIATATPLLMDGVQIRRCC